MINDINGVASRTAAVGAVGEYSGRWPPRLIMVLDQNAGAPAICSEICAF